MTDQQLIQYLQDNVPEDLPPDLLKAVRQRLRESAELRQAVLTELHLEQGLATTLAPTPQRWEELLAEYTQRGRAQRRWVFFACALVCVVIAAGLGVYVLNSGNDASPDGNVETAGQPNGTGATSTDTGSSSATTSTVAAVPITRSTDTTSTDAPDSASPDTAAPTTPTSTSTDSTAETPAPPALTPEAAEAQLFDDPGVRNDLAWREHWNSIFAPFESARTTMLGAGLIMRGDYQLLALPDGEHLLRLPFTGGNNFVEFWAGTEGVRIAPGSGAAPIAYRVTRASDAAIPTAPTPQGASHYGLSNQLWQVDKHIDFNWAEKSPLPDWPASNFCVRWEGQINAPRDGVYTFTLTFDDGGRLTIDNTKVAGKWPDTKEQPTGTIALKAGWHDIVVEYFQTGGAAIATLEWEGPGIDKQLVPTESLRPTAPPPSPKPDLAGLAIATHFSIDATEVANIRRPDMKLKPTDRGLVGRYSWGPILSVAPRLGTPPKAGSVQRTSDDGFRQRLMDGFYNLDFRYEGGQLIVSRADIAMLTAPLPHAPTAGFFHSEGYGFVNHASYMRCLPIDVPTQTPGRVTIDTKRTAELKWLDGDGLVTPQANADGTVALAAPAQADPEQPLLRAMLDAGPSVGTQVDLHASKLTPGSGFAFSGAAEGSVHLLWIDEIDGTRVLSAALGNADENARRLAEGWTVGDELWLRLTYTLRSVRVQVSHDGEHWAHYVEFTETNDMAPASTRALCGMVVDTQHGGARITIDHIRARQFDAYTQLVDAAKTKDAPADLTETIVSRDGASRYHTMSQLIDSAARSNEPAKVEQVLAQLPWVIDPVGPVNRDKMAAIYAKVAAAAIDKDDPAVVSRLLDDWLASPQTGAIEGARPRSVYPADLLRMALWQHIMLGQWPEASRLARRALYLSQYRLNAQAPADPPETVLDLAAWVVAKSSGGAQQAGSSAWFDRWTHPLAAEADRQAAAVASEFLAAVQSQSYDHACRIFTQRDLPMGLVPHPADGAVLQPLDVLFAETLRNDATMRQTLRDKYTDLSQLRLKQAMASNDVDALRAITIQFRGMPAAAEALEHLADMRLVEGQFALAASLYRELWDDYVPAEVATVRAKLRLAAAKTGRRAAERITYTVHLPGGDVSAEDFEAMVEQALATHAHNADSPPNAAPPAAWREQLTGSIVSHPIMHDGSLYILTAKPTDANRSQIVLHQIDGRTGQAVAQFAVMPLNTTDTTPIHTFGQPAIVGNDLLYAGNGTAFRISTAGQVRWIRRLPYFALDAMDLSAYRQPPSTQVLDAGRVIITASGTPVITAVHSDSGVLDWQRVQAAGAGTTP